MPAAPVERHSLLGALWQQTVEPAAVQVLDPEALGSGPVSPRLGASSRHGLNGGPSGTRPHAQARRPEGGRGRRQGQQGRQAGEVRPRDSDAGALQEQDAARHQVGDAQAEQQHLSPLQQAVQSVERRRHPGNGVTSVEGHAGSGGEDLTGSWCRTHLQRLQCPHHQSPAEQRSQQRGLISRRLHEDPRGEAEERKHKQLDLKCSALYVSSV